MARFTVGVAVLLCLIPALKFACGAGETDIHREAAKKQFIKDLKKEHVITLTSANFSNVVHEGNKAVLVDFYAPWCGHCKRLAPEYSKLGLVVARDPHLKHRLVIAQVDADAEKGLASFYEVKGYPTIQFFPAPAFKGAKSAPRRYVGEHQARSIMDWLRTQFDTSRTGRIFALDLLAREFMLADGDSEHQQEVLNRLKESMTVAADGGGGEAEEGSSNNSSSSNSNDSSSSTSTSNNNNSNNNNHSRQSFLMWVHLAARGPRWWEASLVSHASHHAQHLPSYSLLSLRCL
eukprot:jgi/Mesvir1/2442/Mv22171-RA.1